MKAAVLKTAGACNAPEGSNPSLSARKECDEKLVFSTVWNTVRCIGVGFDSSALR